MFKKVLNKIIVFFIPFLFVFNVKCSDNIIRYYYKETNAEYVVSVHIADLNITEIKISKLSSDNSDYEEPLEVKNFENYLGIVPFFYTLESFESNNEFDSYDEVYNDFITNSDKYKPILLFDKNDKPYVISPYFTSGFWEETKGKSNNLNDYENKDVFDLLNGEFTYKFGQTQSFNEFMNIDTGRIPEFVRSKSDAIDSNKKNDKENSNNSSYTGGTCEGYSHHLKSLYEKIMGTGKKKGVCSANSLNAMQRVASIYDLKNNFDSSILEPECKENVFGHNGYINTILDASSFYISNFGTDNISYNLSCYVMQSEYLIGLSVLTSYMPITDEVEVHGCDLISPKLIDFINDLFDTFKIICLCVCIFLCIVDVYKIVITKESEVTKFKTVLVKRVIVLVMVFLIPLFVNIVTDLINNRYLKDNPDKCSNIIRK